jgi:hypothetical protein
VIEVEEDATVVERTSQPEETGFGDLVRRPTTVEITGDHDRTRPCGRIRQYGARLIAPVPFAPEPIHGLEVNRVSSQVTGRRTHRRRHRRTPKLSKTMLVREWHFAPIVQRPGRENGDAEVPLRRWMPCRGDVDGVHAEGARQLLRTGPVHLLEKQHVGVFQWTRPCQQFCRPIHVLAPLHVEGHEPDLASGQTRGRLLDDEDWAGRVVVIECSRASRGAGQRSNGDGNLEKSANRHRLGSMPPRSPAS